MTVIFMVVIWVVMPEGGGCMFLQNTCMNLCDIATKKITIDIFSAMRRLSLETIIIPVFLCGCEI
jgi:hypothetical protein